jgi:acyl-CoA thioesterase FadM
MFSPETVFMPFKVNVKKMLYKNFFFISGHWGIWNIVRILEACAFVIYNENNFYRDDMKQDKAYLTAYVARRQKIKLNQKLHDNISLFSRFLPQITQRLVEIGNSSFTTRSILIDSSSGSNEILAENFTRGVKINRNLKQSTALGVETKREFSDLYRDPSEIWQTKEVFPHKRDDIASYSMSIRVPYSDTDRLQHITHAMYSKYYTDCATNAIKAGCYRHFVDDICWYPILEVDMEYLGDAEAGEVIDVHTWQGENPLHLYFEVKRQETVINKAALVMGREKSRRNRHSKL